MKTIKQLMAVLLIVVSMTACEKGLMTFDNQNADIYFYHAGQAPLASAKDSTYISFSYTQEQDSVIDIRIAVTGGKEDRDREYEIAVDTASTAISGVHFEPLPQKLTIKKGELSDVIKLRLLRTPEMETTSYILKLNLLPNANFGTRFQTRMVGGKAMSTISTKVRIDDVLKKPARWVDANWGVFTRVKLFFVCEFLGITPFYLEDGLTPAENYSLPRMVQRHLDKLKDEGNTKFEADGTPMTMGPQSK